MPSRARHRISSSPVETPPSPPSPRFFRRRWLIEGPTTHTKRRKFVFIGYVLGRACNKPARQTASHSHRRRWRWTVVGNQQHCQPESAVAVVGIVS
uniref:Uncharacterized protein n=1 Tax=Ficus carica TaxID=3494 RepID=A0AA87YZC5_FICCA|nr:hypothetical protein TIFTF001_048949 [Ficus carica]GMN22000.1 hypothetical protein TIFTF001_048952 [Ficus carica]